MLCYVMVTLNTSFSLWLQVFFYSIRVQVEQHPVTGRWSQSLHSFPNLSVIAPNCQDTTKNWCYNHSTSPVRSRYFTTFPFFLSLISASSGRYIRTAGLFYLYHDKIGFRQWITQHYYTFVVCCKKYLIDIFFSISL